MQKKLIPFYNTAEGKKWFDHFYEINVPPRFPIAS